MTIKPCKECGGPVSDKAEKCPLCGAAQPKKTSPFVIFLAVLLGGAVLIAFYTPKSEYKSESKPLTEEDVMSAIQMQAYMTIKDSLKDPNSAKINFYKGKPCGQINAKNSFGGYNGSKRIVILKDINIEGQGLSSAQFERLWKKNCDGVRFS